MKKLISTAIIGIIFSSCAKNVTCTCTTFITDPSGTVSSSKDVISISNTTIENAKSGPCASYKDSELIGSNNYQISKDCQIN